MAPKIHSIIQLINPFKSNPKFDFELEVDQTVEFAWNEFNNFNDTISLSNFDERVYDAVLHKLTKKIYHYCISCNMLYSVELEEDCITVQLFSPLHSNQF